MNRYQKEYIQRVNRVIDYIEANINQELSLEVLSKVALFSPFHFHRIFSAFVGETLNDFVKRKRIEKAASMLVNNPEDAISDIAYYCGFNNISVFCRNFKNHFSQSAQEFRSTRISELSKIGQVDSKNGKFAQLNTEYVCDVETLNQDIMNKIEIKDMPALDVVYCRHVGQFHLIGQVYGKLFAWAGPRGLLNAPNMKAVTVYHDDPNVTDVEKVRQSACITVDQPVKPEGEFGTLTVPAGKHLVGSFEIGPAEFPDAWKAVCVKLSESGYQPADENPTSFTTTTIKPIRRRSLLWISVSQ